MVYGSGSEDGIGRRCVPCPGGGGHKESTWSGMLCMEYAALDFCRGNKDLWADGEAA